MKSSIWIALFALGIFHGAPTYAASSKIVSISHQDVLEQLKSESSFQGFRHPVNGNSNRDNMRKFINIKFAQIAGELGGSQKGHFTNETSFSTKIFYNGNEERTATGTNIILILKGNKPDSEDEPIMIAANYDSDSSGNVVEDNGSGIAALLVLGEYFTKQIASEYIKLEHSVILAATDLAIHKYQTHASGSPQNSTSGMHVLAEQFLPNYLKEKKAFRGVIVLDSLLNYNNESNTQNSEDISKAYPEAYAKMSEGKFAGNFLAMVSRDTDLDKELVDKVQSGWERALVQPKGPSGNTPDPAQGQIDPPLIKFVHKLGAPNSQLTYHFAKSEQNPVWTHHAREGVQQYPAVLLTDTRTQRKSLCPSVQCNYLEASTDPKSLAFIHRTIITLHSILRGQTDKPSKGGAPSIQNSGILIMTPLFALCLRYVLALNA